MEEMSREEFERLKNTAAQKMREIQNKKAPNTPFPDFVRVPNRKEESKEEDLPKSFQAQLPFCVCQLCLHIYVNPGCPLSIM